MLKSSLVLALMLESLYASAEVPVVPTHGAAPSSAYSSALLLQAPASNEVPVQASSASASSLAPISVPGSSSSSSSVSSVNQEEEDAKTLIEIDAYSNVDDKTPEEQLELLATGFSVTGTSTLGNPLPASQREAILRSSVETFDQLKVFAKALIESDDSLRKFVVTDESVTMTYRAQAKLFGFIPMSHLVTVTVSFDGTVQVDGQWWLLLATDTLEQTGAAMRNLGDVLSEALTPDDTQKFAAISDVLRAMHDAAMNSVRTL